MVKRTKILRLTLILAAGVALTLLAGSPDVSAQCALCKTALSNSDGAAATARTLNFAILVLLIPPATIFCSVFAIAFRHRNSGEEDE